MYRQALKISGMTFLGITTTTPLAISSYHYIDKLPLSVVGAGCLASGFFIYKNSNRINEDKREYDPDKKIVVYPQKTYLAAAKMVGSFSFASSLIIASRNFEPFSDLLIPVGCGLTVPLGFLGITYYSHKIFPNANLTRFTKYSPFLSLPILATFFVPSGGNELFYEGAIVSLIISLFGNQWNSGINLFRKSLDFQAKAPNPLRNGVDLGVDMSILFAFFYSFTSAIISF